MKLKTLTVSAAIAATGLLVSGTANAEEPYIGELKVLPYTFCPRGWAAAEGQLLPINQYQSLFSLYGTNFGGDGRTTFGLPDLRGRIPLGQGNGPGLTSRPLATKGGAQTITQTAAQVGSHTHVGGLQTGHDATANQTSPKGNSFGNTSLNIYTDQAPNKDFMHVNTVTVQNNNSGAQAMNITQPYLVLRTCVSLQGLFPSRN